MVVKKKVIKPLKAEKKLLKVLKVEKAEPIVPQPMQFKMCEGCQHSENIHYGGQNAQCNMQGCECRALK